MQHGLNQHGFFPMEIVVFHLHVSESPVKIEGNGNEMDVTCFIDERQLFIYLVLVTAKTGFVYCDYQLGFPDYL